MGLGKGQEQAALQGQAGRAAPLPFLLQVIGTELLCPPLEITCRATEPGEVPRVCTGRLLLLWELSQGLSQPQAVLPTLETPKTQLLTDVFVSQTVKNSTIAHCFPWILGITDTRHRNLVY